MELTPGDLVRGYRIERELGRGGMGVVYVAVHDQIGQRIAIKILASELTARPEYRERFRREARACSLVRHEGLVKLFDLGELSDGTPYLLMELLEGELLSTHLTVLGCLPVRSALTIAIQIASAVAAAHAAGIVHRDLKPSNVMLVDDAALPGGRRAKVLDFGIAKRLGDAEPLTLPTCSAPGTPTYMSPEQCRGEVIRDGQCDVYALGVIVYELLCGHPPFVADPEQVRLLHVGQTPVSPKRRRAELSSQVSALTLRMLRKAPAQRPSMEEAVRALTRCLAAQPADPGTAGTRGTRLANPRRVLLFLLTTLLAAEVIYYARYKRLWPSAERASSGDDMARIAGAVFTMGSTPQEIKIAYEWARFSGCDDCELTLFEREQPFHRVQVKDFLINRRETTNKQFADMLNKLLSRQKIRIDVWQQRVFIDKTMLINLHPDYGYSGIQVVSGAFQTRPHMENRPVTQVTWDGAQIYCAFHGMRLPTEAEWELAARGTQGRRFPWGDDDPRCEGVVFDRRGGQGRCKSESPAPQDVGAAAQDRTAQGVLDLGGNVSEWVHDRFELRYTPCAGVCSALAPVASTSDSEPTWRVVRGGSWFRTADATRAAGRSRALHYEATGDIGFRCARDAH